MLKLFTSCSPFARRLVPVMPRNDYNAIAILMACHDITENLVSDESNGNYPKTLPDIGKLVTCRNC